MADNQDIKLSTSTLGHPPFTPAPDHSELPPSPQEIAKHPDLDTSNSNSESVTQLFTSKPPEPARMSDPQSIKIITEPLNDTNHYKKICFNCHQLAWSYFDFTSAVTWILLK
jgi:hypothetical protein